MINIDPELLSLVTEELTNFSDGGTVRLTHFSNKDGLTEIDPAYKGSGADKFNREVRALTSSTLTRTYWGVGVGEGGYDPAKDTKHLKDANHEYVVDFPVSYIYDWDTDPDGMKERLKDKAQELRDSHPNGLLDKSDLYKWMDESVRDMGYKGIGMTNPTYGYAVYLWVPVQVKQVK